eukprot:526625-Rhodomonas_salina.1
MARIQAKDQPTRALADLLRACTRPLTHDARGPIRSTRTSGSSTGSRSSTPRRAWSSASSR